MMRVLHSLRPAAPHPVAPPAAPLEASLPAQEVPPLDGRVGARPDALAGPAHAPLGRRSWLDVITLRARPVTIDDVTLPKHLGDHLVANERAWVRTALAPGPLYVNGDLARGRSAGDREDPHTLARLLGGDGAYEVHRGHIEHLVGRRVRVVPLRCGPTLRCEPETRGVLVSATRSDDFVTWRVRDERDGVEKEIACPRGLSTTRLDGALHGAALQEIEHGAYQPERDIRGLVVLARTFIDEAGARVVTAPVVGTVIAQGPSHVCVRGRDGTERRIDAPARGFLQVITVPAEVVPTVGSRVPPSGVEAPLVPARPLKLLRGEHGPPLVGQIVDATLVEAEVRASELREWSEERPIRRTRGTVVEQGAGRLVIAATNGERVALDLQPLGDVRALPGLTQTSARSFIEVTPLGAWARSLP